MTGFGPVRPSTGRVKLIALHPLPLHLNTLEGNYVKSVKILKMLAAPPMGGKI